MARTNASNWRSAGSSTRPLKIAESRPANSHASRQDNIQVSAVITSRTRPRHAPMAVVSPVVSLAAALTVLYAWLVLRERPGRLALAGAALASAGVVLLAYSPG